MILTGFPDEKLEESREGWSRRRARNLGFIFAQRGLVCVDGDSSHRKDEVWEAIGVIDAFLEFFAEWSAQESSKGDGQVSASGDARNACWDVVDASGVEVGEGIAVSALSELRGAPSVDFSLSTECDSVTKSGCDFHDVFLSCAEVFDGHRGRSSPRVSTLVGDGIAGIEARNDVAYACFAQISEFRRRFDCACVIVDTALHLVVAAPDEDLASGGAIRRAGVVATADLGHRDSFQTVNGRDFEARAYASQATTFGRTNREHGEILA